MLGIATTRKPVSGQTAREIRAQIERIQTGHLSEKDVELREQQTRGTSYTLVKY